LLAHGEGARHGHLYPPVRAGAQKFYVLDLDRVLAGNLADHARHRIGFAAAIERGAGIVDIDPRQRGGETVGIAFPADFAVGDDIEPGFFLLADYQQGGVILRLRQIFRRNASKFPRAGAWRKSPRQFFAVDKPVWLCVGADE
jgi:hypothetical protein